MPKLRIDNREVEVEAGSTILDAAAKLGIEIPALCFRAGHGASTSCMACVVRVNGSERLVPSCATAVADGMSVESESAEVREARRTAIELLLSDHTGDCAAPCETACPAHLEIPRMLRQIAAGRLCEAVETARRRIPLPATLGRICPAPCEKACRRAGHDAAVSICLLKRFAADADFESADGPRLPACAPPTGKEVAIVGAGAAGLSAAFFLLLRGHACTLFDSGDKPGGKLRSCVSRERLPEAVLDAEIDAIRRMGADFHLRNRVERAALAELRGQFGAVLVAAGDAKDDPAGPATGLQVDRRTLATAAEGIFAAGDAANPAGMAVRAVADARAAAESIDQYLKGEPVTGLRRPFSVHAGKLDEAEMAALLDGASREGRIEPADAARGFSAEEAAREARRCLRCDCRKADDCRLREFAERCGARPGRFRGERRKLLLDASHASVVYEPGKCISCGLCVRIAAAAGEPLGLAFVGRGFPVRVAVPFGGTLAEALTKCADECVRACPTGALAYKD